tara:strand:- start:318 stop:530 length:213 start_codon:yes stop_codon:yes gene_type:complete
MAYDKMKPAEQYEADCEFAKFDCNQLIKKLRQMVTDDPNAFIDDIYYFEGMSRDLKTIAEYLKSEEKQAA